MGIETYEMYWDILYVQRHACYKCNIKHAIACVCMFAYMLNLFVYKGYIAMPLVMLSIV